MTERGQMPDDKAFRGARRRRICLPRWFRRVLMVWATGMLTLMLAGYALYIFRGQWTPEHLADLFRLPLLGGL